MSGLWRVLVDPFSVPFMGRALVEVVLLGALGAVLGVHLLLRRKAFVTEALQHTVFPGVAVAFVAGQSLLGGALLAALASVVLLHLLTRNDRVDTDSALALLIAGFFALGVVVVSRSHSFQSSLTALLFGRVLAVDTRQVVETAVLVAVGLVVLLALHKELVLRAFDPAASAAVGYPVGRLDLVLDVVVALAVVAAVRAVGTVLLVAFLVTPAAAGRLCCRRIPSMMATAAVLTAVCGWLGLAASYTASVDHGIRLAAGAMVVMTITVGFLVVATVMAVRQRLARPVPVP
ncbi:MAG TPA: metal ABC transporter permease [Acidimicrobiales bacterium]|nr:metal ABC transporter permease [Acidimicrobiales bacterium]